MTEYLKQISVLIKSQTEIIRASFSNPTNKGSGFEIIIRNILNIYTPNNDFISHGEIIDSYGTKTGQIDFAVLQENHPTGFMDGSPNIILYDSVQAIGECKMNLNVNELNKVINSSKTILGLKIGESNNNRTSGDLFKDDDLITPPYFLVANECDVAYKTIMDRIENSEISFGAILNHKTTGKGLLILGKKYRHKNLEKKCNDFGNSTAIRFLWETDNPIVALIWAINRFKIPMISLSNTIEDYL